ncbi:MAG: ABC transporter substrate-binding protein [Hyphomicrobiales bacterium]|nr:MAG: ABC transporter substrate-binding protein [Hyphomicrobiales bacterium]
MSPFFAAARGILVCGTFALLAMLTASAAMAEPSHGLSAFGELKYARDFPHFDYVNPGAPKGGRISLVGSGAVITFDTLNPHILKGDKAQGLELLFDSLMVRAADEPDAVYGLVAESADVGADKKSVTFKLRPEARFADGSPLTSADVAYSFETLKQKGHPAFRQILADVMAAEAIDPATVRYVFRGELVRDLPLVVATLPILSKTYYATRNFEETTLDAPLGSGPYRVGDFKQGTFITYARRADYWAKDLPVNRGRFNFDEIRFEYFRDRTVALEALKGGQFDFREEFTARNWATAYDIPAVTEKRLLRVTLPDERPSGAQGFFINTRKDKYKDPRVRKALDFAFNYEWTNKNIFYGLYTRSASLFENSEMKAKGKPSAEELALLEPLRGKLSPAVFEDVYVPPVSDGSETDRRLLSAASRMLEEAGWTIKDGKRVNGKGEVLDAEFLIFEPSFEPVLGNYVKNLRALGIDANIRRVDPAQYERRTKSFDFDITVRRYVMSITPGPELRAYLGSEAAATEGSANIAGIADPAIDKLIEAVTEARSRKDLVTAVRALDRVLRASHYLVPHWFKASHTVAYWDKFARPATKPKYSLGELDTWWFDAEKAAKLRSN